MPAPVRQREIQAAHGWGGGGTRGEQMNVQMRGQLQTEIDAEKERKILQ